MKLIATDNNLNLNKLLREKGELWVRDWLASLTELEAYLLNSDPYFSLRESQIIPEGLDYFLHMALSGRGFGKAVDKRTPILTSNGWSDMGSLKIGDRVFDENGCFTKVMAIYDQPPVEAYRVRFSDDTWVDSCKNHLWVTLTHKDRKSTRRSGEDFFHNWANKDPITTERLLKTCFLPGRGERNHCIPMTKPLNLVDTGAPFDPYLAGYWIGDGSTKSSYITVGDIDRTFLIKEINRAGYGITYPNRPMTIGISKLRSFLPEEMYYQKIIPEDFFHNDINIRLSFLQGLMDSDGCVSSTSNSVEFCSVREDHAKVVLWLARSLGEKPVLSKGVASYGGKVTGDKWRVTWTPCGFNPFRLPRKARGFSTGLSQQDRNGHRMVTEVSPLGVQEGYRCITVDSPNSMYLVGEGLIPTHNTHMGASWVIKRAYQGYGPIGLVGQTAADVRDVMVENNPSSILKLSPKEFTPEYEPSKRRLTWPNGITATTFAGDEEDQTRGFNGATVWCDELAKWKYVDSAWANIVMGLRIGDNPQGLITTTPRPIKLIKELYDDPDCRVVTGATFENTNLNPKFIEEIRKKYEGTRLGEQELYGKILWEDELALWKRNYIDANREKKPELKDFYNLVIGVDPSTVGNKNKRNDETGIIVAGSIKKPECLHGYILEDYSIQGSPSEWAQKVYKAYTEYPNATIIAESNQGGEMVKEVLTKYGIPSFKIELKHHINSKYDRARPVALQAEQGKVHHCGMFADLEDEMCSFIGDPSERSPNRLDAAVIALHRLLVAPQSMWITTGLGL